MILSRFAPTDVEGENVSIRWLLELVANQWSEWLPSSALETIKLGGYYTVLIKPGFRLIALNNNYCYHTNMWLVHSTTYFSDQLLWFYDVLVKAEKNNEIVHIISHIPSNEGLCFSGWAREYRKIIEQFSGIISAIFNGHTHEDEFNVHYSKDDQSKAYGVAWNGGSGTTFGFFNSNFKVYQVDLKNYVRK